MAGALIAALMINLDHTHPTAFFHHVHRPGIHLFQHGREGSSAVADTGVCLPEVGLSEARVAVLPAPDRHGPRGGRAQKDLSGECLVEYFEIADTVLKCEYHSIRSEYLPHRVHSRVGIVRLDQHENEVGNDPIQGLTHNLRPKEPFTGYSFQPQSVFLE